MHNRRSASDTGTLIPVQEAFRLLHIVSDQQLITGLDNWRHATGKDAIGNFDTSVIELVQKQPPSKFGKAEHPSLWTAVHFYLALPALSHVIEMYGQRDETTSQLVLSDAELHKYFIAFPFLAKHYREYHDFVARYGKPSEELWRSILDAPLQKTGSSTSAVEQLAVLPEYLHDKAVTVLTGQGDSLVGRIILAYLLGGGTGSAELGIDGKAKQYLSPMREGVPNKPLFERLVAAQQELEQLDPYLADYKKGQGLRLEPFLGLVTWYARPHLVEMVIPGLTGAAEPGIRALLALFSHIVESGGPDYLGVPVSELPSTAKFRSTQSLEAIGRFSIIKDILSPVSQIGASDGMLVRRVAGYLYSETERREAWGNTEYYIPDAHRAANFATFRQDVANILYCAGLIADDNNMSGTVKPEALKRLSRKLMGANTQSAMRSIMHAHRRVLNDLAVEWELRFAGQERLRLLRFVRQTFGLDTIQPIPIPLQELDKGFAGSYLDGHVYRLYYQEAGEKLEMAITVRTTERPAQSVRYHAGKSHEAKRVTADGIPYSAWLEVTSDAPGTAPLVIPVPGRGSYDPFGRVGSPHAGEVIGFGCSVHHASLALILAELASLGASRGDLEHVTAAFMHINKKMHERHDLAAFQLAQVIAAFEDNRSYTHRDFLQDRVELTEDKERPHLAAYIRIGEKSLAWAEPQAARLSFGYPALYALKERSEISPRQSWYDGSIVELPDAVMNWQVLTC